MYLQSILLLSMHRPRRLHREETPHMSGHPVTGAVLRAAIQQRALVAEALKKQLTLLPSNNKEG